MGSEATSDKDWVTRHLETRVVRGIEWHKKIADHVKLAKAATPSYIRIQGDGYGGAVITQSGDHPNVKALVYAASPMPAVGESTMIRSDAFPVATSPRPST